MSGEVGRARTTRAWGLAAVAVAVGSLSLGYGVWVAAAGRFRPVDFDAFYTGAALVHLGYGARLYDLSLQAAYQIDLLGRLPLNGHVLPFVSPPHLAVLLVPLAMLPLDAAFAVWTTLQLVLAAWLARECARRCVTTPGRVAALAALAAFPMLLVTIYKGQVSLVVLVSLLVWTRALATGRDGATAAALVLGTVKPQMILVPLVITACLRRWRALLLFGGGLLFLTGLAVAVVGPAGLAGFAAITRYLDASFDHRLVYPEYMYNFKGALLLLGFPPRLIVEAVHLALGLALVVTAVLFWRCRPADDTFPLRLALALLLGIFFSPHLYLYDALLLVAVALAFDAHLCRFAPTRRAIFLGGTLVVSRFFLEDAWILLGGRAVRWPAIVMVGWILMMAVALGRVRQVAAARDDTVRGWHR